MLGNSKEEHESILDALNLITKENYMIYTRPNGEIAGLCPPDSELSYTDSQLNIKRSRVKYWNLDGEKELEEKHGWNKKRSERIDLVKIEQSGGIALTQLGSEGKHTPIYTAHQAENLRNEIEDLKAKLNGLQRIQKEYKQKDKNYRDLQTKVNNIKEENKELRESNEDLRTTNEQLNRENEMLRARNIGLVSWRRTLKDEIDSLEDRHGEIVGELKEIWKEAEEARLQKLDAKGVDVEVSTEETIEEQPPLKEEEGVESA